MKTYPITSENGCCKAFELDNVYIGPKKITSLLSSVDGVTQINRSARADTRMEFTYSGYHCVVVEPFGDSSRYWIGPGDFDKSNVDMSDIKAVFDKYIPPLWLRILGSLILLDISGLVSKKW